LARQVAAVFPWALIGFSSLTSCSFLVNPSAQQCKVDDDCTARGGAFVGATCADNFCVLPTPIPMPDAASDTPSLPGDWSCVGNMMPTMPVKTQVQLTVPVNDLIHPEVSVIDSVVMRACRKLDVACAMPISNTIHPDGTGSAVFTVPGGFDGYIEVNPAVNPPAYIPTLIFVSAPLVDDTTLTRSGLLSTTELPGLALSTGATIDPTLGAVFFQAADCNRMPVPGIVGMLDQEGPDTKRFFVVNGLPTQTANATDPSGDGGWVNVPIGVRSVSGTRMADGLFIGTVSVLIRQGTFSYSLLAPQPL
jgi:hypothetical protein